MTRGRRARVEGADAVRQGPGNPAFDRAADFALVNAGMKKPSGYAHMLSEAVDEFRERFPDAWDELALCPMQHGLATMIEKLKG